MRILRFSHSAGVSAYRERERELCKRHNVEIKLVIPRKWEHLGASAEDTIAEDFSVERIETIGTGSIPLFAFEPLKTANIIKTFKPDVVDIHEEPYAVSGFELMAMSRLLAPRAACVFYSAQNILKKYPPPFSLTERYVYDTADGAYPCSEGVAQVLMKKGYSRNLRIIPLGVDPKVFQPGSMERQAIGLSDVDFIVGFFGRIEAYKGTEVLLKAVELLPRNVHLMVVGSGSQEEALKGLAVARNLSNRVHFMGSVGSEKIAWYIRQCNVVAVPSLTTPSWKEQFGRAVTESMACGVPVIASDSGSLPEVVGDGGLVTPENDSASLTAAITRFLDDPTFYRNTQAAALKLVAEKYTWSRVADLMYEFYSEAISLHSDSKLTRSF